MIKCFEDYGSMIVFMDNNVMQSAQFYLHERDEEWVLVYHLLDNSGTTVAQHGQCGHPEEKPGPQIKPDCVGCKYFYGHKSQCFGCSSYSHFKPA